VAGAVGAGAVTTRADVSCRLLEIDYSGIENALTGWFMWHHGVATPEEAHQYIRWCALGLHAAVCGIKMGDPAYPSWPDDRIVAHLATVKERWPVETDICKRVDHGTNYGLTPYGMTELFPQYFHTVAEAQQTQAFLFQLAPSLPKEHHAVRRHAREVGYLGGITLPPAAPSIWDHPYGYRHWFWDVLSYKPCDELTARKWLKDPTRKDRIVQLHGRWFKVDYGGDSKRTCAYYPQSTGSGVLKLAELRLLHPDSVDFIGDAYFGRTPFLHPIHDALLLHLPNRVYDRVLAIVVRVMQDELRALPIPPEWKMGRYLRIGVAAKGGRTWDAADMKKLKVEPIRFGVDHEADEPTIGHDEDQDLWDALARRVA
jgi:hypothetical protein